MNDINVRNVVIVVAAVVVALVVLGIIGGILTNIVPLAIVAVIAFILGRLSHRVNYLQLGRTAAKRVSDATQIVEKAGAGKAAKRAETRHQAASRRIEGVETTLDQAATRAQTRQQAQGYNQSAQAANQRLASEATTAAEQAAVKAEAKAAETPARLVEIETTEEDLSPTPILDVKTVEQIQAEARRVEQEAAKKAQALDVQAALEERRKRLLGGKEE
ncbi:MAG: hypothetical protein HZC41_23430 [Chloroflexi bacterium]|nr:hypothetical protein [Chloroflexota bacterium]